MAAAQARSGGDRDQVRIAEAPPTTTRVHAAARTTFLARSRHRCGASDRHDRPVPVPPSRRSHADRRDPRGARRAGRRGHGRAIGASNFSAEQIEEADRVARERGLTRFCAVQNEYSLLEREAEADVLPVCERLGIALIPYFPLASGLLTGKYRRDAPAPAGTRLAERDEVATDAQWA